MGLLFRPRCPPPRWAADIEWLHEVDRGGDVARRASGDLGADLECLARELAPGHLRQVEAFSDIETSIDVEIVDATGFAEWIVTARHTGRLVVDAATAVEATGAVITIRGVMVADLVDGCIDSVREYVDELALFDGLGLLPEPDQPIS